MDPRPRHSLRVCVLASGSSGNATLVTDGTTTVLVDAGISAREVFRRAAACGVDAGSISAILVTHEHTDHTRGIRVLVKRTGATVCASNGTQRAAGLREIAPDVLEIAPGGQLRVGTLAVRAFRTAHDAAEPIGLRIESDSDSVGIMTDTGHLTEEAREVLAGCGQLALESNHDIEMLETGPYPYFLRRRIRSADGHLANIDAADALEALAHDGLRRVFAMHVSRTNNTYELAGRTLRARLDAIGLAVPVEVGRHDAPIGLDGPASAPTHVEGI